ncbi:MAG: hypothetical protein H6876_11380 [Hyphomicrobiaceae bacterium]|nr:hypothetical protein [Hyphomicrobiaceae bacterium]MCC0008706.1 hypothetical protein [Hyphomicrobiaceae bacterium]
MFVRTAIIFRTVLNRLRAKAANWLLGPIARASRLIADADAHLVGLVPMPRMPAERPAHALL